jgi:hypothetical protein
VLRCGIVVLGPIARTYLRSGRFLCSAAIARSRHRRGALAAAPDIVREEVILAGGDAKREDLAGGGDGDLLDAGAAACGYLGATAPR